MIDSQTLIQIFIALFFSAMFSGVEIAFITVDRLFVELQSNKGGKRDLILSRFKNKPEMFIATLLVGNTLVLVFYGMLMAHATEPLIADLIRDYVSPKYLEGFVLVLQTISSTIVVLITAEFLPKSLFLINPYKVLKALIYPTLIAYYILYPFVWGIVKISKWVIVNVFRQPFSEEASVFGLTDLNNYLTEIVSKNDDKEDNAEVDTQMFKNALEFQKLKVRECMTPRTDIACIEVEESVDLLKKMFVETNFSKIIVYKENIDDIIGYVHHSKLFKKPETIKEVVNDITIVPETILANDLLLQFIKNRKSIALVVDEYGGTAGLISMEDIMEEIFGDIQDEYDDDELLEEQIGENEWMLSARQEINYINENLKLNIPEGDYDTIGGFILWINGDIPAIYDRIQYNEFTFLIKSMNGIVIDKVVLSINKMTEKLD
jgi:putative hemolysin